METLIATPKVARSIDLCLLVQSPSRPEPLILAVHGIYPDRVLVYAVAEAACGLARALRAVRAFHHAEDRGLIHGTPECERLTFLVAHLAEVIEETDIRDQRVLMSAYRETSDVCASGVLVEELKAHIEVIVAHARGKNEAR